MSREGTKRNAHNWRDEDDGRNIVPAALHPGTCCWRTLHLSSPNELHSLQA
jgi:hypothetical protein